jgi:hypothetical protein
MHVNRVWSVEKARSRLGAGSERAKRIVSYNVYDARLHCNNQCEIGQRSRERQERGKIYDIYIYTYMMGSRQETVNHSLYHERCRGFESVRRGCSCSYFSAHDIKPTKSHRSSLASPIVFYRNYYVSVFFFMIHFYKK